ncbi:MAG: FliO/MopB family protein [Phycisphaerales bacterium]|nr:MAG: FliO/MopB family protein [Phycisphaerales bacterium]
MIVEMSFTVPALTKRAALLLTAIALGSGLLVVCFGQSAPNQSEPEKTTPDSNQSDGQKNERADSVFGENTDFSREFSYDSDTGVYSNIIRAVLFVVVLGAAAFYVSKKLLPKITNLPGKEVRVVETVYLGPRKAVHVLEVGSRRFLVGSTSENITKLADITGDFAELSAQEVGYN